jgi:hypothetical protein
MIISSRKKREIEQRRELLLARIALQRVRVELELRNLEQPIKIVDRGIAVVRYLKAHPLLVAAGVAVLTVVGRRRIAAWVGRGWVAWRGLRTLSGLTRNLASFK